MPETTAAVSLKEVGGKVDETELMVVFRDLLLTCSSANSL